MTGKHSRAGQTTDRVHVDELEASTAWNPSVGAGTPDTAPEDIPSGERGESQWWPSRKWWGALFAGAFLIAGHAFASAGWDAVEWGELMVLGGSLSTAYWLTGESEQP